MRPEELRSIDCARSRPYWVLHTILEAQVAHKAPALITKTATHFRMADKFLGSSSEDSVTSNCAERLARSASGSALELDPGGEVSFSANVREASAGFLMPRISAFSRSLEGRVAAEDATDIEEHFRCSKRTPTRLLWCKLHKYHGRRDCRTTEEPRALFTSVSNVSHFYHNPRQYAVVLPNWNHR